jgi:hypothetical protein
MSKKLYIIILILVTSVATKAQTTEINPMIGWRYIFYDTIPLKINSLRSFEFPADKKYDYRFHIENFDQILPCQLTTVVKDLQGAIIFQRTDTLTNKWISWSEINLPHSTTYEIELFLSEHPEKKATQSSTQVIFALIRRLDFD